MRVGALGSDRAKQRNHDTVKRLIVPLHAMRTRKRSDTDRLDRSAQLRDRSSGCELSARSARVALNDLTLGSDLAERSARTALR